MVRNLLRCRGSRRAGPGSGCDPGHLVALKSLPPTPVSWVQTERGHLRPVGHGCPFLEAAQVGIQDMDTGDERLRVEPGRHEFLPHPAVDVQIRIGPGAGDPGRPSVVQGVGQVGVESHPASKF